MPDDNPRWWQRGSSLLRQALVTAAVVALLLLFGWLWWQGVPELYRSSGADPGAENARLTAVSTTRAALLAGLVGLGALGTFWLNSRVYRVTARTFELTEQGQLTDRYTKAIGQLGDDKLDIRLGGIFALERIAVDSRRDHPTIVEVLSAYVRERTAPIHLVRPTNRRTAHPRTLSKRVKLGADVQAALTVLGRLPTRAGVSRADLYEADLTGANLGEANLTGVQLYGANLTGAHLAGANLTGANLGKADLTRAYLHSADLTGAILFGANLTGASLIWANLTGANLSGANLTGAGVALANLTGANLVWANLTCPGLTQEQVDVALGDSKTTLRTGLRRPETWPP